MHIVPLARHHPALLVIQPAQAVPPLTEAQAQELAAAGPAFAAVAEDGRVLAMAGVVPQWPEHEDARAIAWAMVGFDAGPAMRRIHRAVVDFLARATYRRIEAHVHADFPAAIRWIEMLGFRRETPEPMQGFDPTGRACYLYARVR